jgi:hypothetical protein
MLTRREAKSMIRDLQLVAHLVRPHGHQAAVLLVESVLSRLEEALPVEVTAEPVPPPEGPQEPQESSTALVMQIR